jgi:hypothetical protein
LSQINHPQIGGFSKIRTRYFQIIQVFLRQTNFFGIVIDESKRYQFIRIINLRKAKKTTDYQKKRKKLLLHEGVLKMNKIEGLDRYLPKSIGIPSESINV